MARLLRRVLAASAAAACLLTFVWPFTVSADPGDPTFRVLAMVASALHIFCDLVAGGPTWPVYPLWPASSLEWSASWSWTIGEWPNIAILFACLAGMFAYARFGARSPLECFGDRADAWFIRTATQAPGPAGERTKSLRWIIWAGVILGAIAILAPLGFRPVG